MSQQGYDLASEFSFNSGSKTLFFVILTKDHSNLGKGKACLGAVVGRKVEW